MAGHPAANEFADMLEQLFVEDPNAELQPPRLTETASEKEEMSKATTQMKQQKSIDERGRVTEQSKHAPDIFIAKFVDGCNDPMTMGKYDMSRSKTLFKMMLFQNLPSKVPPDYQHIASIQLFYQIQ